MTSLASPTFFYDLIGIPGNMFECNQSFQCDEQVKISNVFVL